MAQQGFRAVLLAIVGMVAIWLLRSASSACDPRDLALVRTEGTAATFQRADGDGDSRLTQSEFAVAAAELRASLAAGMPGLSPPVRSAQLLPPATSATQAPPVAQPGGAPLLVELAEAGGGPAARPAPVGTSVEAAPRSEESAAVPPHCSIFIFWHVVKTAGTTMRTVLQRQAQLSEFEYVYSDTTLKPRWQLLMHQLAQRVAPRRIILELHSEWGLPRSLFGDVALLRRMYEPLGCRVTLGTVLRHPLAWYLSMFNWRASNTIPLCQWQPPRDGLSRQVSGFALPFTQPGPKDRDKWIEPATVVSVLEQFDVVGLTERFDESLLLLAERAAAGAGMQHIGYSTLAANNKPQHPKAAKKLLRAMLEQLGLTATDALTPRPAAGSALATEAEAAARAIASGAAAREWRQADWEAHRGREAASEWGEAVIHAAAELNEVSMAYVEGRGGREKADCNFYPCEPGLKAAKGVWSRALCPEGEGGAGSPAVLLAKMLNRSTVDRAVHAYVVRRLDAQLAVAERQRAVAPRLQRLREQSAEMARRRLEALGPGNRKLCGVRLCDKSARRSCVACPSDPVPALESCWPSWEDQFSPDELKWWCKRSWTVAGYDAAEMKARNYPRIAPPDWKAIPCWQTCWESMQPGAGTCLEKDAPSPTDGKPGPSCPAELRCSPACASPLFPSLPEFWADWEAKRTRLLGPKLDALNISGIPGRGG